MVKKHLFKRIVLVQCILTLLFSNLAYASPQNMVFDNINYIEAGDNPVTFKADFWRT
jgi:hypothetical protein